METSDIQTLIETAAMDKKSIGCREGSMMAVLAIVNLLGKKSIPFIFPLIPAILHLHADKSESVAETAEKALKAILSLRSKYSLKAMLPFVFASLDDNYRWPTHVAALKLIHSISISYPKTVAVCLSDLIPVVGDSMWATKPEVAREARDTMVIYI